MNKERTGKWLRQVEHTGIYLWHRYFITVNQVRVATVKLLKWWLKLNQERYILHMQVLLECCCNVPGENRWPVASRWQTLSHNVVHLALIGFELKVIGTDCIGSCKFNYHTITTTTDPSAIRIYVAIKIAEYYKWHK